ncbi:hypothetical protein CALVIDRAFT_522648 [Calocera viscosa TUFC12733]|uniref:PQ-loop-domain-containing protein n=1 Tax=Calocera viscosa (strain TUFC12733) TaxID=1330018 RepID=A0A167GER2_CALVF|nr:hypothetical protein CALVIDRAFT_522648 [Calocera viscosa TUFC12733]
MPLSLSDVLGYTSILSWLFAQFPQLIVNWKLQSAEGLALPFLVNWLFGDLTNLLGCILTHQLPFQTYLATYFCCLDVCLLSQYLYYTPFSRYFLPPPSKLATSPGYGYSSLPRSANVSAARGRSKSVGIEIERGLRRLSLLRDQGADVPADVAEEMHERIASAGSQRAERSTSKQRNTSVGVRKAGMVFLAVGGLFGFGRLSALEGRGMNTAGQVLGELDLDLVQPASAMVNSSVPASLLFEPSWRMALEPKHGADAERIIGRVSAWTCTTLYLTSRLPQIWKNFVRKSVAGLSMSLFISAFLGNLFYVLSILTSPQANGPDARAFLLESVPYLLGSGGVLMFDITIVTQGWLYRNRLPLDLSARLDESDEEGSRGRSRGRRPSAPEADGLLDSSEPVDTYHTVT